ncbi:uncharacterized protein LOC129971714 [Argiope bruennichi]|uniref:uncharacterized protein LOC129971714 n=1 Tax=Argiope bruennichi TaxID=94029 RepID=UPI002493E3EE|nr:uncharacterized protein LOC129971714 [Argiope bruennichi]
MAGHTFLKWNTLELEWKIISVTLNKLEEHDQLHIQDLFSFLSTISSDEIQKWCKSLTASQKLDFFKNKPTYFIVQENFISKAMSFDSLKIYACKKFCSSARFIMQCFGSVHFLEIKKVVTFVFEDVAQYMLNLSAEEEKEFIRNIRNVSVDESGVLTLTTSRKVGSKRVSSEEKCLLAVVYYLSLHGRTHFKKLFEEIESFAKNECYLVSGECSDSKHLAWLKKHDDYFQVHQDNFVSLYEEYSSYKCDYQKLKRKQLPLQIEPVYTDIDSSYLSQAVQILTSANELNDEDNTVTSNRSICKKFYISATYLTSCFNPLHYLEIKECIFFLMEDVANVLRKLSLSRLQKIFEKVPFTSMDENGFLHFREDCNFDTSFVTKEEMLNLFVVYYLGFCGKTHFEKVIEELKTRAPETLSNTFSELPAQDQLKYFKDFPQYFIVNKKGELDVIAGFILPYYEYKNDTFMDSEPPSKDCFITSDKYSITERVSSSIAFLLQFFQLKVTLRPLRIILHVLIDAKVHFLNLTALDQIDFIKVIFSPFTVDERNIISCAGNQYEIKHLSEKEMEFLYFACLISKSGRMHYRQAIDKYFEDTGKVPKLAISDSMRFRYFKAAEGIFQIGSDGYIVLCPLPQLNMVTSFFSEIVKTKNTHDLKLSVNHPICANFNSNNLSQIKSSFQESCSMSEKNSSKDNVPYATVAEYKKLCGAVSFLLTFFNSVHCVTMKHIISFVLTDVGKFLSELPLEEQNTIFKSIPQTFMDPNGCMYLTSFNELHSFVSKNKKQFLFITCFLAVNGETHYQTILNELNKHQLGRNKLTCSQFYGFLGKYPKYFTRKPKGYVILSHSFDLPDVKLQDCVNSVPSDIKQKAFRDSNSGIEIHNRPTESKYPLNKKIQDGILYLLQYFTLNIESKFLQVLFLVLDYHEIFHNSSINDKIALLKKSFSAFKVNEDGVIFSCSTFYESCLVEGEKEELLISFIVFEQKEMHFLKIFQELSKYDLILQQKKFDASAKFRYFKKRKDIFHIDNDGYVSLINCPDINLDSSAILRCFSSTEDIIHVRSENNSQSAVTKKRSQTDQFSDVHSSISQSEHVCENKAKKNLDKIFETQETNLLAGSTQFDKYHTFSSNKTEIQNINKNYSLNEKVKDKESDFVEATSKFNANNFSPNTDWFIIKNDQSKNTCGSIEDGILQLEGAAAVPDVCETEDICKITEKDERMEYSEKTAFVSKFNSNMFIPSKEWFSSKCEVTNTEDCATKTKYVRKPVSRVKSIALSSNPRIEIENKEELKFIQSDVISKPAPFNINLPVPEMKFLSANTLAKETSILAVHNSCNTLHDHLADQKKCVASSSNSSETEKVIKNIEKSKFIQSKTIKKATTFNVNLPVSTKNSCSATTFVKKASTEETYDSCDILHDQHILSQKNVAEILVEIIQSITSILKYYDTKVNWLLVCIIFQVMNDVRNKFSLLSKDDQSCVLKKIFEYFSPSEKKLNDLEKSYLGKYELTEEQENLLVITCILSHEKKIDYIQLFKKFEMLKNDFRNYELNDSDKYQYLLKRDNLFSIEAGFVKLHPFPNLKLKSQVLEAELKVWKHINSRQVSNQQTNKKNNKEMFGDNLQISNSKSQLMPSGLNYKGNNKSEVSKNELHSIRLQMESFFAKTFLWPKNASEIYGELNSSIIFLQKSSDVKVDWHLVCVVFQVMNEIRSKFLSLSKDTQISILNQVFIQLTFKKESSKLDEFFLENYPLNEEQETLLLMACIIAREKKLDYLKLFEKLGAIKKNMLNHKQTDFYIYINRKDHLFSMEDGYVKLLPFPSLELKRRVLAADLRIWKVRNYEKNNKKSVDEEREVLGNDVQVHTSTTKLNLSNLNRLADKLIGPKIASNSNQTFCPRTESNGSKLNNIEEKTDKLPISCDYNTENKLQTPNTTFQLTTSKFCQKEKVDKSISTNEEEISDLEFQTLSSSAKLEFSVTDSSNKSVNKKDVESKSQIFNSIAEFKYQLNNNLKKTDVQPLTKNNDGAFDVRLKYLEEETNNPLLLKEFDFKNNCQTVIESNDTKPNPVVKEVGELESLNDKKLDSENISLISNHTTDCKSSKLSNIKELNGISSKNRKKRVDEDISHNFTPINAAKICGMKEQSCELSYEDKKEMILERKSFQDSESFVESNVSICNVNAGEGMEKKAEEFSPIKNKENIMENTSNAYDSKTKLNNKEKPDESQLNNNKVSMKNESHHNTSAMELRPISPNIKQKQIIQSLPASSTEAVSKNVSSSETKTSKFICLEEKNIGIKTTDNVSVKSKVTQNNSMKTADVSKDSSTVMKESLNKLCKRMQAGIIHLLKYFHLTAENLLLKVLCHILDTSKLFISLSNDEKMDFLQNCFHIFYLGKNGSITLSSSNNEIKTVKLKHEEKILLSMSCILSQCKEMHNQKIFLNLQNQLSIPAAKEQFSFFRKRTHLFSIANNGYVKLCNFPDFEINSTVFSGFFQTKIVVKNMTSSQETSVADRDNFVPESGIHKKESNYLDNEAPNLEVTSTTENKVLDFRPGESLIIKDSSSELLTMHDACKKVKDAIYFLLNYFKLVLEPHLVCVILHALKDVQIYFANLNVSDQNSFVKESLSSFRTDSNGQISKVFYLSLQFNLNNNEKDMLFLCFILGQVHKIHYQEIFNMYAHYQRAKPTSVVTCSDIHKYFSERTDLFSLNSDGYVKLNLQYIVDQNSKILPVNAISADVVIRNSPLLNSVAFKNIQIIQQSKICERQSGEVNNKPSKQNNLKLKRELYNESIAFLNGQSDKIMSDCADVIILHVLDDLRDLDRSERRRLLSKSGDVTNNDALSSKSLLSEEEKDLLIIASTLVLSGPLHHCKLFELLEKQNRDSLKILTELEQRQYILQKSKFFNITNNGIVSFNATSNTDIENLNHFDPASEEYFKISLSKNISTENDSCCDKLIDSLINDIDIGKNKIEPNRASRRTVHKPTFDLLEIISEENSRDTTSFHPASKTFSLLEFSDAASTRLEQQSVYFFTTLLTNYKMANSLKEHLYLATKDIQNHLKIYYNDNINHFLEIHQMSPPSF